MRALCFLPSWDGNQEKSSQQFNKFIAIEILLFTVVPCNWMKHCKEIQMTSETTQEKKDQPN